MLQLLRQMLRLFPTSFRNRYGDELADLLIQKTRDVRVRHGWFGVIRMWAFQAHDLVRSATLERRIERRGIGRSRIAFRPTALPLIPVSLGIAARSLRRQPVFAVVASLTLALGIGATTAIFSVVNGVLLKPLAFDRPEQLVSVAHTAPGLGYRRIAQTAATYLTYQEENRTFDSFGVWNATQATVTGLAEPELVDVLWISEGALMALGVRPQIGRLFRTSTSEDIDRNLTVISHCYWQRQFGADENVIGQTITLNGSTWEIVGVLHPGFRLLQHEPSLLLPNWLPVEAAGSRSFDYHGLARLRDGVDIEEASRDVERMIPLTASYPWATESELVEWQLGPNITPLKSELVGDVGSVLWVLFGTFSVVLLVACANVANLFLVRAEARQRELAIRTALGGARSRIAFQLLTESVLLGLLGGAIGLGIAYLGLELLLHLGPSDLPRLDNIGIDGFVLLFTLGSSILVGVLFGLFPVTQLGKPALVSALGDGGRGSGTSAHRQRVRKTIAVAEVALALVLLIGSGLLVRSFQSLRSVEPGFSQPEQVLTLRLTIPLVDVIRDRIRAVPITEQLTQRLSEIPWVESVGATSAIPMERRTNTNAVYVEDFPLLGNQRPRPRSYKAIAGDYFQTMGIPLLAGRTITWEDVYGRLPVGVVSENFAREYWGNPGAALGRRVRHDTSDVWREIVGVVGDIRDVGLAEASPTIMYWPMAVEDFAGLSLWVRRSMVYVLRSAHPNPKTLLSDVREAIWSGNPNLPLANVQTLEDVMSRSMARTSFTLILLALAAGIAVALGSVGVYGVISYVVSLRSNEIGVRLALGATKGDASRLVLRQGAVIAFFGILVGLCGAVGGTRFLSTLLYGVTPLDPTTLLAAAAAIAFVSLLAAYMPARRAAAVDPVRVLRTE